MKQRVLATVTAAVMILAMFAPTLAANQFPGKTGKVVASKSTAPAVARPAPIAIGAMRLSGTHLVPPARDALMAILHKEGLPLDVTPEQIQAAAQAWYARFQKQTDTWPNANFQEWAQRREAELTTAVLRAQQIQPVTATILYMAVDFGATETFTIPVNQGYDQDNNPICVTQTVTITGPLNGMMAPPPPTDNFTLWYSPTVTADASFYEKLMFGYEGAGRVRFDLTDPDDGQPGINLAGYTMQDYYDHVAGEGNVYITGTVEGWVTVPHSEGYYGADICETESHGGGAGVPVAQLVIDAIEVFSQTHPGYYTDTSADAFWPKFDGNGDGIVDSFGIIHAGAGQEAGGGAEGTFAIWSHSSDLRNYAQWPNGFKVYEGDPYTTTDDIFVGPYTMQPENLDVGVLCEEFGHNFFGLPDLYTLDANNSIGDWNIMSGGAWMGWLGGTAPASMPLWFKMIAAFDVGGTIVPVNWHVPMVTRNYNAPEANITIGQLEKTPPGVNKGVRVNLPPYVIDIENMAGTGKGAYSGSGRDQIDIKLSRPITIATQATGILTIDAYWEIEEDWDYGYVMVNGKIISDTEGVFTNFNPNGNNLGWGLTGAGEGTLRFDLSEYAGQTVTLTLRYKTDAAVTEAGWWVDNIALDGVPVDAFESASTPGTFPGWTNSTPGWLVVPTTKTYNRYYLVEWRALTKYDQMIAKTAYIHNYADEEHGDVVSRIPYNMPAALLYYRDTRYGATYYMRPNAANPPSYGSKYQLLIVDQNWQPTRIFSGTQYLGYWSGRISSYDAGLTLQATQAFTIPRYYYYPNWPAQVYPSKPAVTRFNDALGYYAGFFFGPPCPAGRVCFNERDGSAVIPARGLYSTRIVDFNWNPIEYLYGVAFPPSWLGSGNPGDDNVQFGVNIELLSKAGDDAYNSTATLKFWNQRATIETTHTPAEVELNPPGGTYTVTYQTVIKAEDFDIPNPVAVTYTLDSALTPVSLQAVGTLKGTLLPPVGTVVFPNVWWTDEMYAGDVVTVTLVAIGTAMLPTTVQTVTTQVDAYDGEVRGPWFFDTVVRVKPYKIYLPLVMRNF